MKTKHLLVLSILLISIISVVTPITMSTVTTSDSPGDSFQGTVLDSFKWDNNFSYNGGQIRQDNELIASTSASYAYSAARVFSQYQLLGDFDIQVDFRVGSDWSTPITASGTNPHIEAEMGIYVDDPHRIHIARIRGPAFNIIGVYSSIPGEGMLAQVGSTSLSGKFRIVRAGLVITYKYDTGTGWRDLYSASSFATPVQVYLQSNSVSTNHAFTAYFDNFLVNSGPTNYAAQVLPAQFQRRDTFGVGGFVCDYLAKRVWDNYWKQKDPLQVLKENGFQWVRVGVLTTSSQYLSTTPPSSWSNLPWRDEYWSSLEYAEQILREAANKGFRLNVFFFLSDKAAHAGQQYAPAEWANLSVNDTAARLETYAYDTTRYFIDKGLNIELYDIGNEIEWGILNFRPGERVTLPAGVDTTTNMDYMKNNVWNIEATLLQSAISGVKRANPNAKIVLHISGVGISPGDLLVRSFFQTMVDAGVQFDYAGLSHPYPFTGWSLPGYSANSWFQRLQRTSDFLAALGKKVIFSEAAYPHDTPGIQGDPMPDFPYTPAGQALWVQAQLLFASNNQNVAGFNYFYPEFFPGMSGGSNPSDESEGLFASDTQVQPAMEKFRVNLPPVAAFTANTTSGNAPLTVTFTDQSTGLITSRSWNFGDGSVNSTDTNPSHQYTAAGTFNVSLTVTWNGGGSDTNTKNAYITVNPGALDRVTVSPSRAYIASSGSQQFTAAGYDQYNNLISGLTYIWTVVNSGGNIDASGMFTAGGTTGTFVNTVKATTGGVQGTATAVIGPSMTMTATLQGDGRPAPEGQDYKGYNVPLKVKLYDQAVTNLNIKTLEPVAGGTFSTTDGNILITGVDNKVITFTVGALPPAGTYWVTLHSPHNLVNLKNSVAIAAQGTVIDMGTLLEGDAQDITEGSVIIDIQDFVRFGNAYETGPGMANWNATADFDRNGWVRISDFGLLYQNYGKTSPQTVP